MFRAAIYLSIFALVILQPEISAFRTTSKPKNLDYNDFEKIIPPNDPFYLPMLKSYATTFQKKLNLKETPTVKGFEYGERKGTVFRFTLSFKGITVISKENKSYKCEITIQYVGRMLPQIKYLNCV